MDFENRKCACIAIYNKTTNKILLGQRSDTYKWCFAGGKEEPCDFSSIDIAIRKLKEEFGISLSPEQKEKVKFLGECFVKGSKRIKRKFRADTFVPALYITNVFLLVTDELPTPKVEDGEMYDFMTIDINNAENNLALSPSTAPVLKMVKKVISEMSVCYFIKAEFKNGVIHNFMSAGKPKMLENCIIFDKYSSTNEIKEYVIFIDALNYYTITPASSLVLQEKGE